MARQNKTTEVTMHSLDVTEGKMKSKYNRPKRFLGALFKKILLPSLIVAGVAVGAFALIPALSTAVSLTFANAALIGAGTFAATSTLIGGGTIIHEKASARRRVKKALRKNLELEAMDFIQPKTIMVNGRAQYANGINPPQRGKGFWRRRNMLYEFLKQNRHCCAENACSNHALVQRIVDGHETSKFLDLVVLAAKRGYLGDRCRDAIKDKENKQKLKNLKYLSEPEADQLMEDVFGIENHFKTLGVSQGSPVVTSSRKSKKSVQKDYEYDDEASLDALRQQMTGASQSQGLTPEQLTALAGYAQAMNAQPAQPTAPVAEPNSYTSQAEKKDSLVKAVLTNPTPSVTAEPKVEETHGEIEDKSLIKSIVDEEPKPAPAVAEVAKTDEIIDQKKSLLDRLGATQQPVRKPVEAKKPQKPLVTLSGKVL